MFVVMALVPPVSVQCQRQRLRSQINDDHREDIETTVIGRKLFHAWTNAPSMAGEDSCKEGLSMKNQMVSISSTANDTTHDEETTADTETSQQGATRQGCHPYRERTTLGVSFPRLQRKSMAHDPPWGKKLGLDSFESPRRTLNERLPSKRRKT
jgi:hypothetical protein